jgi:hypothetical protein
LRFSSEKDLGKPSPSPSPEIETPPRDIEDQLDELAGLTQQEKEEEMRRSEAIKLEESLTEEDDDSGWPF